MIRTSKKIFVSLQLNNALFNSFFGFISNYGKLASAQVLKMYCLHQEIFFLKNMISLPDDVYIKQ